MDNMEFCKGHMRFCEEHFLFVREQDRRPGLFHVIEPEGILGRRKGFIFERANGATYAVHLILSATGKTKREFIYDFSRRKMQDFPHYWVRFTWRLPAWWFDIGERRIFGSVDAARGVTAESLL